MKAVFCETHGGPEALVLRDIDPPGLKHGEVLVALRARGVSYVDLLQSQGKYQVQPPLPYIPGGESAGDIVAVADGVSGVAVGDRVLCSGGWAELVAVPATRATVLPASVSYEAAAAFRSNYTTAYYGLQRGRLRPGEVLLVHGAAGGVGLAAVDVGKLLGAVVIGTASSDAKLAVVAQMGADHVINYRDGFRDRVREITGKRGADVIYDPVGGPVFDESMRCVAPFGRILVLGFTSGVPALAKTNHLLIKDAEAIGFTIGALSRHDPAWAERNLQVLWGWLASGRINPHVSHRIPLADAIEALRVIQRREVIGKVVLV